MIIVFIAGGIMTGFELKIWRRGQGWNQQTAADKFGISLATYKRYEKSAPPTVVVLAIRHLSLGDMYPDLQRRSKKTILARLSTLL